MSVTIQEVDAAITILRTLRADFEAVNDPTVRLQMWAKMDQARTVASASEIDMRKAVFPSFFSHDKGTETRELGGGAQLKGEATVNYKVDKDRCDETLDAIEKLGERAAKIAEDVIKYEPKLSLTEYNKLVGSTDPIDQKALAMINTIVTSSPGTPTLKIVPPKTGA
jgi:hypothetical protein